MLKVLIVDDELLARLALRTAIPWEENGFEVVAEAEDGITGFQYVQQYRPDILLTDISMPGMNGVDLIKKAKEILPEMEIIILSCHNDFEYVKEGMRAGAADYILKLSMSMEGLLNVILQLKDKIIRNNKSVTIPQINTDKDAWIRILFSLITQENLSYEQMIEDGKRIGFLNEGEYALLAVVAVDSNHEELAAGPKDNLLAELAESVMSRYKAGLYVPFDYNRSIIFCQLGGMEEADQRRACLKEMLGEMLGLIQDYLGVNASAGVSSVTSVKQLRTGYQQAYTALSSKFYIGPGNVHIYSDSVHKEEDSPAVCFKEVLKAVDLYNFEGIQKAVELWLMEIERCKSPHIRTVRKEIHELLFQIGASLSEVGAIQKDSGLVEQAYHMIQGQSYLEEMKETLRRFLKEIEDHYGNVGDCRREIVQARKYVELHYQENIRLLDVANYVNMNVDYFSHLFKKETGTSFTDYLNQYRIDKAKKLLLSGKYKVYETAFAVGFQDENYFIKRFKKQTGFTPMEFIHH